MNKKRITGVVHCQELNITKMEKFVQLFCEEHNVTKDNVEIATGSYVEVDCKFNEKGYIANFHDMKKNYKANNVMWKNVVILIAN